jgi:hypothetical protein
MPDASAKTATGLVMLHLLLLLLHLIPLLLLVRRCDRYATTGRGTTTPGNRGCCGSAYRGIPHKPTFVQGNPACFFICPALPSSQHITAVLRQISRINAAQSGTVLGRQRFNSESPYEFYVSGTNKHRRKLKINQTIQDRT